MKNVLIINGPNLNLLGEREPGTYGSDTYDSICAEIRAKASELGFDDCECFQSNHEGAIVDKIQEAYGNIDGIIINPAAYTHTSVAILDALKSVGIPAVEVHLTDVNSREDFRKISYAGMACIKTYAGFGFEGYAMAAKYLREYLKEGK